MVWFLVTISGVVKCVVQHIRKDLDKGHFPHKFNTADEYYVGSYPDLSFDGYDRTYEGVWTKFMAWYQTVVQKSLWFSAGNTDVSIAIYSVINFTTLASSCIKHCFSPKTYKLSHMKEHILISIRFLLMCLVNGFSFSPQRQHCSENVGLYFVDGFDASINATCPSSCFHHGCLSCHPENKIIPVS